MPSTHETIGLLTYASRVPALFARRQMKKFLIAGLDPDGRLRDKGDSLIDGIADLRRTPDAVAILDETQSMAAGLPEKKHILFVEVEYSSPIPEMALDEYADIYDFSFDTELPHFVALAIVDRYGCHRYPDLGGIFTAMLFLNGDGICDTDLIDAYSVRRHARV